MPNGYGSTYEMDGLTELGIMENVTCEEREPFVDENTTVKKEEKKAFKLLWEELKEKLMYKPVDYIFEDVNKS